MKLTPFVTCFLLGLAAMQEACSTKQAFSEAASPVGTRIASDFASYVSTQTDPQVQAREQSLVSEFTAKIQSGDAPGVSAVYFGPENLRGRYVAYLDADPKFHQTGGVSARRIKSNNLDIFDYIVTLGRGQAGQ